jgi:D-tyrosyl-tRNA(Tyr) deacylase
MAKHTVINRVRIAEKQARAEMELMDSEDWDYKDAGEYLADAILRRLQGDAKAFDLAYVAMGIDPYCPRQTLAALARL